LRFLITLMVFTFMLKSIGAYNMVEAKSRLNEYKNIVASNIEIEVNDPIFNKIFISSKKSLVNYIISKVGEVKSYEAKLSRYQAQLDALS